MKKPILLCAFLSLNVPCFAETIYVDADATGANDGSSWANAYKYLQDALADADVNDEIRVAQGIYRPDENSANPNGTGNRNATFQLINGVALKGGYAGYGQPDADGRNFVTYETILSGDLHGNDFPVTDPCDLFTEPTRTENSYHVVTTNGGTAILDGFAISAGNSNGSWSDATDRGGGMVNRECDLTLSNCTFRSNSAGESGGGMYNRKSNSTLTNCTFSGNSAESEGGGLRSSGDRMIFLNCTFIGNSATYGGGVTCSDGYEIMFAYCNFIENSTRGDGGGLFSMDTWPKLTNCIFIANFARHGAGMFSWYSIPTLANCTFTRNSADIYGGGFFQLSDSAILTNCILWDNVAHEGTDELVQINKSSTAKLSLNYNCIQGWSGNLGGTGNIGTDPWFANPKDGDYHLKSQRGRWDPNSQSWVRDNINSSCIDAGNRNSDWSGELWPHGKRINMGAYGGTPEASKSLSDAGNIADLDADGCIGYSDVMLFTNKWLYELVLLTEDFDISGFVNFTDFTVLADNWGFPCEPDNPNPADGATDVDPNADLSWTAGLGATSHDVYFGTSNQPPFTINKPASIFDPGTMASRTTYYWRIDEVGTYDTTPGAVWSFTTMSLEASNPNPADGATGINITSDLSWTASPCATSHDVYFGTSNPPLFIGNQTATTLDPGTMDCNTTFFWRIDEVGAYGTITGTVWSFTTAAFEASNPNPADGSTGVNITSDLSWMGSPCATSHDVYFGTSNPPLFIGNQTVTTFDPGTMTLDTTYYWRIDEVVAYGTITGTVWRFTTFGPPPGQAVNPDPSDGETNVSIIADLGWVAGSDATSHDVYFGTSNPPQFIGNQTATTFDAGTMVYYTTYYWRIDEVNPWGTTTGAIWSFTTMLLPQPPPGQARNPNPANWATEVCIYADLGWTASGATSHDIYFGTSNPPPFIRNQTSPTFDPCTMDFNMTYYWRIDSVNTSGKTTGAVWRFTTAGSPPPPPGQASNPCPADGATGINITSDLSWTASPCATSHDVYFGTSNPPMFIGNQTATTFDPSTMAYETTYFWRIDEVNPSGTNVGTVWTFTTYSKPPPPPPPPPT
jgi:predicted outer membrane repeat protein